MIKSLHQTVVALLWVGVSVTVSAHASQGFSITATAGELTATDTDGNVIWKFRSADLIVPKWERGPDGVIALNDGMVIDELGRLLARQSDAPKKHTGRDGGGRGSCPYWSELAQITPPSGSGESNSHNVPLFDSQGDAWVINTHLLSGDYELQIQRSNGHDGTWGPLETISDSTNYVAGPEGAIDPDDNITIVFRDISGGYKLYAMRYEPGGGWSGPNLVYSTATFFQAIEAGGDYQGNVAAIFDPANTVWSAIYDASSGTWGSAHRVSPAGYSTMLPTVVGNRAGDGLYLIYRVTGGGPLGLYAHRFDSAARSWGPAELLPWTSTVSFSGAGPASRYPATVDPFGEATVFWQSGSPCGVYASRTEAGIWQSAHELLAPGPYSADMENFAHAESSESGDAFGVLTRYEAGYVHFYAFRYRAGIGWDAPYNPYTYGFNFTTRSRIAPYRGAYAVGTLFAPQSGTPQLTSLLYDGTSWQDGLLNVPETYPAFFQEIKADQGEPLLVFEAEELIGDNFGIWATWLRNLPGDLDGDGDVDLSDLATLLASYNLDEGGDVDGDGDTDLSDLAALLANYGSTCP
ncbi:MAG: hypothetical protein KKI02_05880 [Planctomycetes bacterium]|nr:hypothetical protein [Planctomycetota bacterium]